MELFLSRSALLPAKGSRLFVTMRLLRACWFPALLSLFFLSSSVVVGHIESPYVFVPTVLLMTVGVILAWDSAARLSDYLYYRSTNRVLNSLRLLTNLRKSFCSRQVGIALYGKTGKIFYKSLGYKWYHILPDGTFRRDSVFFRRNFWRKVFGYKTGGSYEG